MSSKQVRSRDRRITIKDVAREADVSITTVSFVLNDAKRANISQETRERVLAAAAAPNYRPNAAAATLRTNRTHSIGFITDHIAASVFAGDIILGAHQAAWEAGMLLTIINTGNDLGVTTAAIEMLIERRVDGIICSTLAHRIYDPPNVIGEVPAVLLNCADRDGRYHSVVPDEVQGGFLATQALLQAGHRHIGFLNFHNTDEFANGYPPEQGRLAGYRHALADHGVGFRPDLVIPAGFEVRDGFEATRVLLERDAEITALFCGNDRMAMGAYYALTEAGRRIPDDISVVGFDDQQLISTNLRPALSTVALPFADLGRQAVRS
ncbi:MAG TPA: LacI family DNA-binding transcriptional regulator, partial [Thermomicrobiales bacterium]|nr:LacI family DNA-binding transcriptional regulator [Thermomicrobiales bacterium]